MNNLNKNDILKIVEDSEYSYLIIDPLILNDENKASFYDFCSKSQYLLLYANTRLAGYLDISPPVIRVNAKSAILQWFLDNPVVFSQGIIINSKLDIDAFSEYFRQFIVQTRYDDEGLLIRLFDPLVMQNIKDILNEEQLRKFFLYINSVIYMASDKEIYNTTF